VHALDLDVDGIDVPTVLRAVIGDPRVWYAIHDRTIYSRTYGFEPRAYTGSNPHTSHVHVSIRYTNEAETDSTAWLVAGRPRTKGLPTVDYANVTKQARAEKPKPLPGVRHVQRALNDRLRLRTGRALTVDGVYGARTREVVEQYQDRLRRLGARSAKTTGILTKTDTVRLGRGRYKVKG
jgi:hypothetical protein